MLKTKNKARCKQHCIDVFAKIKFRHMAPRSSFKIRFILKIRGLILGTYKGSGSLCRIQLETLRYEERASEELRAADGL